MRPSAFVSVVAVAVQLVACDPLPPAPLPLPPGPPPAGRDGAPRPVVFVHGIDGRPADWRPVLDRLSGGRTVVEPFFAADGADRPAGSVGNHSLWAAGFYREARTAPRFYTDRPDLPSIGAIPRRRTDLDPDPYRIAYADQLARIVEEVCRITGSDQVDLVGFSMGGLVARAYTRWRSVRGSRSRVRRLLLVGSPNRGVSALEAIAAASSHDGDEAFMKWGEIAEMNAEFEVFEGRSYVDWLNDDWDRFVAAHGIRYASLHGTGTRVASPESVARLFGSPPGGGGPPGPPAPPPAPHHPAAPPDGPIVAGLLFLGPTWPDLGGALLRVLLEDSDGTIRVSSARMDGPEFAAAEHRTAVHGEHADFGRLAASVQHQAATVELIRRWLIQDRPADPARLDALDVAPTETGLRIEYALAGGDALAGQVVVEDPGGPVAFGFPLFEGRHRIEIPLSAGPGDVAVAVRLVDRDGFLADRRQRLVFARATTPGGAPSVRLLGHDPTGLRLAVDGLTDARLSARVDGRPFLDGRSAPALPLRGLPDGWRLVEVRGRGRDGSGIEVEAVEGLEILVRVEAGRIAAVVR